MNDDQTLSVRDFFAFGNEAARQTAELRARFPIDKTPDDKPEAERKPD